MLQLKLKPGTLTKPLKACSRQRIISPQPQPAPTDFPRLPLNHKVRTRIKGKVKARAMGRGKAKSKVRGKVRVVAVDAEAVQAKATILATKQGKTNKSL